MLKFYETMFKKIFREKLKCLLNNLFEPSKLSTRVLNELIADNAFYKVGETYN